MEDMNSNVDDMTVKLADQAKCKPLFEFLISLVGVSCHSGKHKHKMSVRENISFGISELIVNCFIADG